MTDTWPMDWPIGINKAELDPYHVALSERYAEGVLRMLTLHRVGGGAITIIPCTNQCRSPHYYTLPASGPGFHPYLTESGMYANCFCHSGCGCDSVPRIYLPPPVGAILAVTIDGIALPTTAYRVENDAYLVRIDGLGWPSCAGENFKVTYQNNHPVDITGRYVGGLLAHEFYKGLSGDSRNCRLPSNVTSVSRSGMSIELSTGLFPDGMTGIREVDMYIIQWNPNALKVKPTVWSPDLDEPRQVP